MSTRYQDATPQAARPILPPIDTQRLLTACGEDLPVARQLLHEMQSLVTAQTEQIARYASSNQAWRASEVAHSLKGAASILGATPLHLAACSVETALNAKNNLDVQHAVNRLRDAAQIFVEAVPVLADSLIDPRRNSQRTRN